jgi:hypothetical protein
LSWVELAPLLSAKCDQFDHKFQPSYQKQQPHPLQPHPLKDKTGDDYAQSDRGNNPQTCGDLNGKVGDHAILPVPYLPQKTPAPLSSPGVGDRFVPAQLILKLQQQ